MRILQLVDVPWDSGIAHYALTLSAELKKRGHQVFVSTVPGEAPWRKARRLGLKTVPLATVKSLTALRRFVRQHQLQVLNAHTGSTHSLAVGAALGYPVAVVRTRGDARVLRARLGSALLFRKTQRVIAAAGFIREAFVKNLKLSPSKVVTVYQGIAAEIFGIKPLPEKPVIGIVARLDPVKGHRYLLEATAILRSAYPDIRLKIVGQEENIRQHDLQIMADRLRIDSLVEFAGFQKDIPSIMAGCSLGVIASTGSEAVCRVALEWMAAGRAIVATRVGCLPELVNKENGALVEPKDAPALAQAIAAILHRPKQLVEFGQAGRQLAGKAYSMETFAQETERVYFDAMKDAGCPA